MIQYFFIADCFPSVQTHVIGRDNMESNVSDRTDEPKDAKTSVDNETSANPLTSSNSETMKDDSKEPEVSGDAASAQKRTHDAEEEEDDSKKKRRKGNCLLFNVISCSKSHAFFIIEKMMVRIQSLDQGEMEGTKTGKARTLSSRTVHTMKVMKTKKNPKYHL